MKGIIRQAIASLGEVALRHGAGFRTRRLVKELQELAVLRDLLARLRINCVIDVGANSGQFARGLRKTGYAGHILSFEPVLEDFRYMEGISAGDALWQQYNFALGSENTSMLLNVARREAGTSTVLTSFLDLQNTGVFLGDEVIDIEKRDRIEVRRLDGLFDELLEPVSQPRVFLKIDTQGFDVEVMKGAAGCMDRFLGLLSEISVTPIYDGMPHYTEALAFYESCGFSLMDLLIVGRTDKQSILEYDCLMARLDELDK